MGSAQYNQRNFVWTMATQFQGLHNLNKVSQLIDPTFTGLTVNALFSIIFAIIYGTAYVAMFIILIARMCVLWITIMLSPLVAIGIVFPDLLTDKMDIQQQFLDHAFVPVKMAIPLALGYILISQMSISIDTSSGIAQSNKIIDLSQGGDFARGVSITTLMYGVSSIAVIWFAVFTASEKVVGHGVVESIKGYVEGAGSTVAKWPTYLPIFPISGTMASVSSITGAMTELQSQLRERGLKKDRDFYDKTVGKIFPRGEITTAIQDIENMVRDKNFNAEKARSSLSRLATDDPARFKEFTKQLSATFAGSNELARILGVSTPELTNISDANIEKAAKALSAPGGGVAPSAPAADYSQIGRRELGDVKNIEFDEKLSKSLNLSDVQKKDLQITESEDKKKYIINVRDNFATFMSNIGTGKLSDTAVMDIIKHGQLKKMTESEAIRTQMAADGNLLTRLKKLIGDPKENADNREGNKQILELYASITKKSDGTAFLGITSDGDLK